MRCEGNLIVLSTGGRELSSPQPSCKLGNTIQLAHRVLNHLQGDTRSLILHPASTTHRQLTAEQRTVRALSHLLPLTFSLRPQVPAMTSSDFRLDLKPSTTSLLTLIELSIPSNTGLLVFYYHIPLLLRVSSLLFYALRLLLPSSLF